MSDKNQVNLDREAERLYGFSPTGKPIVGTLESVPGIARFDYAIRHKADEYCPDSTIVPYFVGSTDLNWDGQSTRCDPKSGEDLYVDDDGDEWTHSQISWRTKAELDFIDNTKGVTHDDQDVGDNQLSG